jgi:MFS family permease
MPVPRDRSLIFAAVFFRAVGIAMTGVLAGLYLARLGLSAAGAGAVIGAGLAGAAVATFVAAFAADAVGRRRFLVLLTLTGAIGCLAVLLPLPPLALSAFAFLGMLNGMGRDRGAALVVEQAMLPATASDDQRTRVFAWYNVLQDAGHALGSLLAGAPVLLRAWAGMSDLAALRVSLGAAALFGAMALVLYARLSPAAEPTAPRAKVALAPETRRILWGLSALFSLDGLGGGFLTASLVAYFFFRRFGVNEAALGGLFFAARLLNALSHFGAAWLARRIGLVNTMVFTHMPSSLLLVTVAIAPSFPVAAVLFLLREGLVEMDVPTRQSYVMAVVRPEERTVASGVTHLVRVGAWAVGPAIAGWTMQSLALGAPLAIASVMKIGYDALLWRAFRHVKPPEERTRSH